MEELVKRWRCGSGPQREEWRSSPKTIQCRAVGGDPAPVQNWNKNRKRQLKVKGKEELRRKPWVVLHAMKTSCSRVLGTCDGFFS